LHGQEAKYLLLGLARCGACGGTITVRSRSHGKKRAFFYACSSFHHRGRAVCPNSLEMRLRDADEAILAALERDLLAPDVIEAAMSRAIAQAIEGDVDSDTQKRRLVASLEQVQCELQRLTAAILAGGEAATLVQAIKEKERHREVLARDLMALERPRPVIADAARLREELRKKLAEWRSMLRAHVPQARQMIRKLIRDRIVFTPDPSARLYRFVAPGTLVKFFNGLVYPRAVASPTGTALLGLAAKPPKLRWMLPLVVESLQR
jgi:site-specific DNA recombinase